ncbi:MAG: hypothetical protein ACI9KN_001033, partial [Gammaproteobacteria bacterium]
MILRCLKSSKGTVKYALPFVLGAIVLTQSACVTITRDRGEIENFLLSQQPELALAKHESQKPADRNKSLYLLDEAMLLRMLNRYEDSNRAFEKAKALTQKLDAISLREQAVAVSINDSQRSYLPRVFEQVLVHCFQAINYLQMQQYDEARVEILQLDELLKQEDKIQMPFARYLSGLVFEFNRELDNALISYRKAYQAYGSSGSEIPLMLKEDLLRLTDYLGLSEEHKQFLDKFALSTWPTQREINEQARAIAFVFNGLMPRKHSFEINVQSPTDGQLHRISTPFYEQRAVKVYRAELSAESSSTNSELIAQLDNQARAALKNEMPAIIARTIARVSIKSRVVDKTRKDTPLLSLALNIATFLSEQADTRAWNTLPQQILIMRLNLPAGSHDLTLKLSGSSLPGTMQS